MNNSREWESRISNSRIPANPDTILHNLQKKLCSFAMLSFGKFLPHRNSFRFSKRSRLLQKRHLFYNNSFLSFIGLAPSCFCLKEILHSEKWPDGILCIKSWQTLHCKALLTKSKLFCYVFSYNWHFTLFQPPKLTLKVIDGLWRANDSL